jgi:hypothetical protein
LSVVVVTGPVVTGVVVTGVVVTGVVVTGAGRDVCGGVTTTGASSRLTTNALWVPSLYSVLHGTVVADGAVILAVGVVLGIGAVGTDDNITLPVANA